MDAAAHPKKIPAEIQPLSNGGTSANPQGKPWAIWAMIAMVVLLLCSVLLQGVFWLQRSLSFGEFIPLEAIGYWKDDAGGMTVSGIRDVTFRPLTRETERVPSSRAVHWLAVDVRFLSWREGPLYLRFPSAHIGKASMWISVKGTGRPMQEQQRLGTEVPVADRSADEPLPVFVLDLARLDSPWVYISIESQNGIHLRPKMLGRKELNEDVRWRTGVVAVLAGVLVASLANLWVWWRTTREQRFVWLALTTFALWFSVYVGKGFLYNNSWFSNVYWSARVTPVLLLVFAILSYKTVKHKNATGVHSDSLLFSRLADALSLAFQMIACFVLLFILMGDAEIPRESLLLAPLSVFLFVFWWVVLVMRNASNSPAILIYYICLNALIILMCGIWVAEVFGWSWLPTELPPVASSSLYTVASILFFFHLQWHVIVQIKKQEQRAKTQKQNLLQYMEQEVIKRTFQIESEQRVMAQRCAELTKRNTVLSHELRSPLSTIIGLARLNAKELMLSDGVQNDINTIQRLAKQLLQIVDDGLALLRVESVKACNLVSQGVVCTKELEQDIKTISEWMSGHHENAFIYSSNASLPAYIRLNEQALRQICTNLITNAGRYCENGLVMVEFSYVGERNGRPSHVVLKVDDSGRGIDPVVLKDLFESRTSAKDSVGLGMGMLIVKQLVDASQGSIEVRSSPNSGTTVTVILPATAVTIAAEEEDSSMAQLRSSFPMRGTLGEEMMPASAVTHPLREVPASHAETHSQEPADLCDLLALARTGMYTEIDEVLQDWRVLYAQDAAMLELTTALKHCLINIDFQGMCTLLEDALRQRLSTEHKPHHSLGCGADGA